MSKGPIKAYIESCSKLNIRNTIREFVLSDRNEIVLDLPPGTVELLLRIEKGFSAVAGNLKVICDVNEKEPYNVRGDVIGDFYLIGDEKQIVIILKENSISRIQIRFNILVIENLRITDFLNTISFYLKEKDTRVLFQKLLDNEERSRVERVNANIELLSQRDKLNQFIVDYRNLAETQQQALNEGLFAKLKRGLNASVRSVYGDLRKTSLEKKQVDDQVTTPEQEYVRQIQQINWWGESNGEYVRKSIAPLTFNMVNSMAIAFYKSGLFFNKPGTPEPAWTKIAKTMPMFAGHYQPRLPGELGFYDPVANETIRKQMELARHYGIYGFCIFSSSLNADEDWGAPLENILNNPDLDLPFCICLDYGKKAYTQKAFDTDSVIGLAKKILPALMDERYIKLNGKPVLVIHKPEKAPGIKKITGIWREYFQSNGAGNINLFFMRTSPDLYEGVADAYIESPRFNIELQGYQPLSNNDMHFFSKFNGKIYDYSDISKKKYYLTQTAYKLYKTVMLPFDDTPKNRARATIYHNFSIEAYMEWLRDIIQFTWDHFPDEEKVLFIDSWNGWMDGTQLEPNCRFGYSVLQATAECLQSEAKKIIFVSHDAFHHGAQLLSLHIIRQLKESFGYNVYLILRHGGELVPDFEKYTKEIVQIGRDIESISQLVSKIRSWHTDIAICNTVVSGDVLGLLADQGICCISLIHEMPDIIRQMEALDSFRQIVEKAEKIVFPSDFVRKSDLKVLPFDLDKTVIRPQGLYRNNPYKQNIQSARDKVRNELGIAREALIVLGVGIADGRKGFDLFAKCAKRLQDPRVCFVWVGNLETPLFWEILSMCKNAGLIEKKRVVFIPAVEDVGKYFAAADLYLLTSREDPFPSVVIEAMDAGVPVIAFEDCGGYVDIVSGNTGMLVPKEDTAALCSCIRDHLYNEGLLKKKSKACLKLIRDKFDFNDYVNFLLNVFSSIKKK